MFHSLKSTLRDFFEPAASAYHGWRNFHTCFPEDGRVTLDIRRVVIEATVAQAGMYGAFGLFDVYPDQSAALLKVATLALLPTIPAGIAMGYTCMIYGRKDLYRRQRLQHFRR